MNTVPYIKMALESGKAFVCGLVEDLKDDPLAQPTAKGGNHAIWIVGHLAYSEANIVHHMIQGNENPLVDWKTMFDGGTEPTTDANDYPSLDELKKKMCEIREHTMSMLAGLSDDDLDKPAKNCPEGYEKFFGTVGQCLLMASLHPMMHYGQLADTRRVLGRKPLMA